MTGCIDGPSLRLLWSEAPWDTAVFGFPVLQIERLEVLDSGAAAAMSEFNLARDRISCGLVSCRLPHQCLAESMLLEDLGFRFIEMIYQPVLEDVCRPEIDGYQGLTVSAGGRRDLPEVLEAAGSAFGNERIHIDPRLSSALGDLRYQNWVRSSVSHPSQRLQVLRDGDRFVAFFVTELLADGTFYWHLNGVAPKMQGMGYGRRAWKAMLFHARAEGASRVRSSIVARNHRVLNLYARLGFQFPPPQMTFHWVRGR